MYNRIEGKLIDHACSNTGSRQSHCRAVTNKTKGRTFGGPQLRLRRGRRPNRRSIELEVRLHANGNLDTRVVAVRAAATGVCLSLTVGCRLRLGPAVIGVALVLDVIVIDSNSFLHLGIERLRVRQTASC
jgi:hypothetical protein